MNILAGKKLITADFARMFLLSVGVGLLYWVLDAALDSYIMRDSNFLSEIFMPERKCLWARLLGWGVITGFVLYAGSISGKNRMTEKEIATHIRQQRAILNNIPDIAWLKDREGRFIDVNESFGKACGMSPGDLAGRTDFDIWPEDLARMYRADDKEVMATGRRKQVEETLVDKYGNKSWIETIKTPIYNEKGEIAGTTGIARDITDRRKVDEELRKHRCNLEQLVSERNAEMITAMNLLTEEIDTRKKNEATLRENEDRIRHLHGMKMLGELAAGVAHEVRNPLHALISVTEALSKELKENPDFDIYLVHIRKQVERLSILMRDLLDLGKPTEPSHMRPESLPDICMASIDLWRNSPSGRANTISFSSSCPDKVVVIGDSQRLQQVFLNLLENASHHSAESGEIRVLISGPEEDMVRVRVVDNGSGVPEDILPRIFEPFFTTRKGGTGLGLSIIKNIVEGHEGSIHVRNNHPLPGCTAEVVLPMAGAGRK